MRIAVASVAVLVAAATTAVAAPPPPTGAHPRMLLDRDLRAAWKEQAAAQHGPVVGAIALCDDATNTRAHDRAPYQSDEWNKIVQACLVAWAATDKDDYAKTTIRFQTALFDDLDNIGDGKGGDAAALRDSGYAIRNMGAASALAYDWLWDKLTPAQRDHARARWAAWLAGYAAKGYRPHAPGSNYHAGFAFASTTIAIAEAGEAGAEGDAQWTRVADEVWGKELGPALAPGGKLAGGDWFEGWQYAPLSVAEISLGARLMRKAGVAIDVAPWLSAVLRRHVYALSPSDEIFAGGDTETEKPNVPVFVLTLDAVAIGDATADDKRWARSELGRLKLADRDNLMYDALAGVGDKPVAIPRDSWPTWYMAEATQTLYARSRWDDRAIWFVAECAPEFDMDHRHTDAGNFVLSRGRDDVVVDPSPYGSFSSLTSNAPTVRSAQLPSDQQPSQGSYGGASWSYAAQTATGVVAARCDYVNRFKYHETASDVPEALRDLVLLPSADGTAATLVVVDRAATGAKDRDLYLRFRTPGKLALAGTRASATIGGTRLSIDGLAHSSGTPSLGGATMKDCEHGTTKGACEAARFPITDYRIELAGPQPRAAHALSVTDASAAAPTTTAISGEGWSGASISGTREAVVVWPTDPEAKTLSYAAPRTAKETHVVLDAPEIDDRATVTAKQLGASCAVEVVGGGSAAIPARPLVITLDANCAIAVDRAAASAPSAANTKPARTSAHAPRNGCCDSGGAPGSPVVLSLLVLGVVTRRARARSAR